MTGSGPFLVVLYSCDERGPDHCCFLRHQDRLSHVHKVTSTWEGNLNSNCSPSESLWLVPTWTNPRELAQMMEMN